MIKWKKFALCEGALYGEHNDMYPFAFDFMGEHLLLHPLSEVLVVVVDGVFDQDLIKKLGFINAHFISDQLHLLDLGLAKMFGKSGYKILE